MFVICFECKENYDKQLNNLFNQLKSTSSSIAAKRLSSKIWKMWTIHPSEESLTNLLAKGSYYMSQNQLTSAHNVFSKAIELDPKWAEAWNKKEYSSLFDGELRTFTK